MKKNGCSEKESSTRKRGRPAGKNRVPLTLEERRARNTQYERERRNEKSKAMAELAEAVGCESSISAPDLLATVINKIQDAAKRKSSEDIENLRRINENLMSQISKLESQLMLHCPEFDSNVNYENDQNSEPDSEQQAAISFDSSSSDAHPRRRTVGKRKRKIRCEESYSQDSVGLSTEANNGIHESKRLKYQLETHHENHEVFASRRETRSCSTSLSSYKSRSSQPDLLEHEVHTMDHGEFDRPSISRCQTSEAIMHSEPSITTTPALNDANVSTQLRLPSMLDTQNGTIEYYAANTLHQPRSEYTPEIDCNSMSQVQETAFVNEYHRELDLLPVENLSFLENDVDFFDGHCEWFTNLILNSSVLDNGENNCAYS